MTATTAFLDQANPEALNDYAQFLKASEDGALPGWAAVQFRFLSALDAYVEAELARSADFEIASHEAGGQCRVWFPHYRVRGSERMLGRMRAILDARLSWAGEHLFHGYVDCHEVHHEPETFLYFQMPLMHLTFDAKAVAAVEDFAHHVGNWVAEVPAWYDWEAHGFRSTWLGTRDVRNFAPYDYQEANHFRFIAVALAAYAATGNAQYLSVGEDYAARWCDHIEARAAMGEPIECSILPEGAQRKEMGYGGKIKDAIEAGVYPVFYATVAQNTTYDIATVLLDLFRLTGSDRYRAAAGAMIAQFFDHPDASGRPPAQFSNGQWVYGHAKTDLEDALRVGLAGSNDLLVRMAEKYRAVAEDTRFDAGLLRWASSVDEATNVFDQLPISLMVAAHRITGDAGFLKRAGQMALRGLAVTEGNTRWHQCDSSGRYGFKYPTEVMYHPMLAGVDYATRGSLPMVGLAHATSTRPGLPDGVAVRSWEPDPRAVRIEVVNGGAAPVSWTLSADSGGSLQALHVVSGEGRLTSSEKGWIVSLPAGERMKIAGEWEDRRAVHLNRG